MIQSINNKFSSMYTQFKLYMPYVVMRKMASCVVNMMATTETKISKDTLST